MRQFGRHQAFPLTVPRVVTPSAHSYTRKGQAAGTSWWTRMEPWVVQWGHALEDVIQKTRPFTSEAYEEYLRWYITRTRIRVTHTPTVRQSHTPTLRDMYPTHRDQASSLAIDLAQRIAVESGSVLQRMRQGIQLTRQEISLAMKRIYDTATDIVKLNSCTSCINYSGSEMDDYDYDDEEVSGHPERYGRRSPTPFDLDAYMAEGQQDTLRPSQLGGAPPITQPSQQYYDTPAPAGGRPTRQVVPPSPL
ncbi:hypothetical protein EJB05_29434, partial [Eragrostis curvula]